MVKTMKETINCLSCLNWKEFLKLKKQGLKSQKCVYCNANEVMYGRMSHLNYNNEKGESFIEAKDRLDNWLMSFDQKG